MPPRRLPDSEPALPEKVLALHEALSEARIPHAIGGALALAYYAEPRATVDVDINVFVAPERWADVIAAIAPLGVDTEPLAPEELLRDGQCRLWWGHNPVDLFFSNDAIHDAMRGAVRKVPFAGEQLPIIAPEHLAVCKAMFDRPKDWIDIEQMLVATEGLDAGEVETWLIRMVGAENPRLSHLRELRSKLGGSRA